MRAAALALLLALPACIDLPEPSDFGAHVVVAADPGLELCGGTLAHMDEFVARLSAEFSLDPPTGDDRFTFYWLGEEVHKRTPCPPEGLACAFLGASYSPHAPLNHELVHNVTEAFGHPRPLFSEGIAVAFEGLGADTVDHLSSSFLSVHDLLGLTTSRQLIHVHGYATAGAFTSFLIRSHGLDAYLRVYAAMGPLETARGVDRLFREEFGVGFDDSVAAFEAASETTTCSRFQRDARLLECAAPELEWDGDRLLLHRSIACDQDDAVGPYGDGSVVVFRTVEIPEDGDYRVHLLADHPDVRVSLTACAPCGGLAEASAAGDSPSTIPLAAGRHSLRLHAPVGARGSVGLRIERVAAPTAGP